MNDALVIRPVDRADFEAWKGLWDGYNAFYGRSGATALPTEITPTTWARFFDPAEPIHALVAVRGGTLLGLVHFLYHRSTTQLGLVCYLQDLFTLEAARGQGVGRALIQAVYDQARRAGSPRVYWQTHETNASAIRLYDTLADRPGFVIFRKQLQEPA